MCCLGSVFVVAVQVYARIYVARKAYTGLSFGDETCLLSCPFVLSCPHFFSPNFVCCACHEKRLAALAAWWCENNSAEMLQESTRNKISIFCQVPVSRSVFRVGLGGRVIPVQTEFETSSSHLISSHLVAYLILSKPQENAKRQAVLVSVDFRPDLICRVGCRIGLRHG